jgi:hypothetical protein
VVPRAAGPERRGLWEILLEMRSTRLKDRRLEIHWPRYHNRKASRMPARVSAEQLVSKLKELPSLYLVLAPMAGTFPYSPSPRSRFLTKLGTSIESGPSPAEPSLMPMVGW